jgi:hypothetical protein
VRVFITGIVKTCHVSSNIAIGKQTKRRPHVYLLEVRILTECGHKAKREEHLGGGKGLKSERLMRLGI